MTCLGRAQSRPNAGDQSRIKQLEAEIEAAQSELDDLQARSKQIEDAIEELNEKIKQAGGSKLLMQRSKVDSLRNYISTLR